MKGSSGQASVEYVAVVAVVATVLAGAAALTSGGIGTAVEHAIRSGLCEVTGSGCAPATLSQVPNDLAPCPLRREESFEDVAIDAGVMRVAGRLGLAVERMSDGKVRVSFTDTARAGIRAAAGAHLDVGKVGLRSEASAEAGVAISAGRVWVLPNSASAERFIARYAASQQAEGRLRQELGRICAICSALAGTPQRPPKPDENWFAGGLQAGAGAGVSAGPASADLNATLRGAIGHRLTRGGRSWFVRIDDQAAAAVDGFGFGIDGQIEAHAVAAVEIDRAGHPRRLRLTAEHQVSARRGLRLPARLKALLGASVEGHGESIESELVLPLRAADDLRSVIALLRSRGARPSEAASFGLGRLRELIASRGVRTVRRFRLTRSGYRVGAGAGLGVHAAIDVQTRDEHAQLIAAATRLPGLNWLPRADCLAL